MSVLLEGAVSCGKTAIAAKLAAESNFPFIRMISPDQMIGMNESQRCASLLKTFTDSYRSPLSIIFIDDIERIIEYTPVGHRFSNSVLQTLLILLRKVPPSASSRLMVVGTTSVSHFMEDLQLTNAFNIMLHVSQLQSPPEFEAVLKENAPQLTPLELQSISGALSKPIGIKQLLMVLEMARPSDGTSTISCDDFLECLHTVGF